MPIKVVYQNIGLERVEASQFDSFISAYKK